MKDGSDSDWKASWKGLPGSSPGACPTPEIVAAFVENALEGPRKDALLEHLAACPACREDVVAARGPAGNPAPLALRLRLYRLLPARGRMLPRIAVAAAVLFAVVGGAILLWPYPKEPVPVVVAGPSKSTPAPKVLPPSPDPRPEPPLPLPEPPPPVPKPIPVPVPVPDPVKPPLTAPAPEPPAVPKPVPAPEKPAVPEKPAPEPTRVALKGSVFAIAGSCSAQSDGDATSQALRAGQKRDFAGMIKLKADVAAAKFAIGSVTYYLQRSSELSILLEEGRATVRLARGEAFFDVIPGKGQFVVETAQGQVTVKGTRFLVSADKAETEVLLQRGAVNFTASDKTVSLSPSERSSATAGQGPSAPQKADLTKRLSWVRSLEDSILIDADQMALQGGMAVLPDPTASGGRAIGVKAPLKAGQEAVAEILAKHKQAVPYIVWVRLHWSHGVPSALTLSVGDALTWSSKGVAANPAWQWVRVGTAELPEERFRVRLTDTQFGLRVDQVLITTDPELNPEAR